MGWLGRFATAMLVGSFVALVVLWRSAVRGFHVASAALLAAVLVGAVIYATVDGRRERKRR
jgi:Ni,Fe-hydrogenase I cytochrome b subunit